MVLVNKYKLMINDYFTPLHIYSMCETEAFAKARIVVGSNYTFRLRNIGVLV